jgi:hypothetical protein
MPDFFSTFNPTQAVKDVSALAMKKYELDAAASRFNQEMGMKKSVLDMETQKFQMEKDAVTKKNLIEQAVKDKISGLMKPTTITEPSAEFLETSERINAAAPQGGFQIDPSLVPNVTRTVTPQPTAEDLARALVEVDPSTSNLKELVAASNNTSKGLAPVNQKDYTPESFIKYSQSGNRADLVPYRAPVKEAKEPEEFSDPYTITVAGKPVRVQKNLATKEEKKIAEDVSTTVRISQSGQMTDKDIIMPQLRTLPKLKKEAQDSARRVRLYQDLSAMADKGAGGLVPGLKGILSPVLEALGMDSTIESEAQAYQLMSRAGVGSMRLMLVGSGQVSNYEQDLMQRLSGGSIKTSREAAKLLFKYYAKESQRVVEDYNQTVDDVSGVEPNIGKVYKKIQLGGKSGISSQIAPKNAQGWKLNTDAKGNKAYVSPDGKQFEEVK